MEFVELSEEDSELSQEARPCTAWERGWTQAVPPAFSMRLMEQGVISPTCPVPGMEQAGQAQEGAQ